MWKKIEFNKQNIKHETDKAVLIKLPNKSKYNGYTFWFPSKFIDVIGGKGYFMSFSYKEDFVFNIFKNDKKIKLSSKQLEEIYNIENQSYLIVEEPEKITKKIEVKKELINVD
jgi:hypothetical protein